MYSIITENGITKYGIVEFIIDTEADIENLPGGIAPGSIAFVVESSKTYMLNNDLEWKLVNLSGGGDGGGSGLTDELIFDGGEE